MILGDKGKCFRDAVDHLTPSAAGKHTVCQMAEGCQVPGRELSPICFASGFGEDVTVRLKEHSLTRWSIQGHCFPLLCLLLFPSLAAFLLSLRPGAVGAATNPLRPPISPCF